MTTYLKFTDYAAFAEAFAPFMHHDQNGDPVVPSHIGTSAVDVIGTIWRPTGEFTSIENGNQIPEMAAIEGFHVNLSGDCPAELEAHLIDAPASPVRVFAGAN